MNYYVLPAEYRDKIRLVSSQEEIQAAMDQGKLVLGCVNPSYDMLPEGGECRVAGRLEGLGQYLYEDSQILNNVV